MVIIEMKEAAYNKAFDLLDEAGELDKKRKMVLCELEDAIYECYEASKGYESPKSEGDDVTGVEYRRRGGMRYRSHEDDEDMYEPSFYTRRGMRMRRSANGRYSY